MSKNKAGKKRELLFSVTRNDCKWTYFKGSGKGGQKRNKTSSAVRCVHPPSKAVGTSQDERSQHKNRVSAFRRMFHTDEFQKWLKIESARQSGALSNVRRKVEKELEDCKVEVVNEKGKWEQNEELKVTRQDVLNTKED